MRSFILLITLCSWMELSAQQLTLEQAIQQARENNKSIRAAGLEVEYQKQMKRTSSDIGKTGISYVKGQYNSYAKDDNNITITQSIPFPTVFSSQRALSRSLVKGSELRKAATENELIYQVKQVYYQLIYLISVESLLARQDSIFENFVRAADLRYRTGETKLLEKTTAETQRNEVLNARSQTRSDILACQQLLKNLTGSNQEVTIDKVELTAREFEFPPDSNAIHSNPELAFQYQQIGIAADERKVASARSMPDITIGYFNQTLINTPLSASGELATRSDRFQGFQIGLSIPVWFVPHAAKVRAARTKEDKTQAWFDYYKSDLATQWEQAMLNYRKNKASVDYYQTSALKNAELILRHSELAFRNGEIDYVEYSLSVRNAIQIRESYLASLNNLNQTVISLEFLAGIK